MTDPVASASGDVVVVWDAHSLRRRPRIRAKVGLTAQPSGVVRRFGLVYGDLDAETRDVEAIGARTEHGVYRLAVARMQASEGPRAADEPDFSPLR